MLSYLSRLYALEAKNSATFSVGNIEALKWIAFVLMIGDHFNTFALGGSEKWLGAAGRAVLPLFIIAISLGLSYSQQPAKSMRLAASRMLLVGLVATPLYSGLRGHLLPLNIMFSLALALLVLSFYLDRRYIAAILCVPLTAYVDYINLPVVLLIGAWLLINHRTFYNFLVFVLAILLLWLVNANFYALFAIPIAWLVLRFNWQLPRVRYIFYWLYPLHLLGIHFFLMQVK